MRTFLRVVVAAILGVLLLVPLALLFDAMNWAFFNSWGLAHGSFVIGILVLGCAAYVSLGAIPWFSAQATVSGDV